MIRPASMGMMESGTAANDWVNMLSEREATFSSAGPPLLESIPGSGAGRHLRAYRIRPWRTVGCLLLLLLFLCILVVSAVGIFRFYMRARDRSRIAACTSNLFQVGSFLMVYHDHTGKLPAAFEVDRSGNPCVSWRVRLMGLEDPVTFRRAAERYHYDEPWNGPHNRKLADHDWGRLLECPFQRGSGKTSYVAIVGRNTLWPAPQARSLGALPTTSTEKILLMEIPNSDIPWMEPRDITFEQALQVFVEYKTSRHQTRRRHLHCYTTQRRVRDLESIASVDEFKGMLEVE